MRFVWERDHWWWEECGLEGVWWWGARGQAKAVRFSLRYPDKFAHAIATLVLTLLGARWLTPRDAALVAFGFMWLGWEVLSSWRHWKNGMIWMGSWKDALADLIGAVAGYYALIR